MYLYRAKPDTRCPFCSRGGGELLYVVTVEEATTHFLRSCQDSKLIEALSANIRNLWQGETCSVVKCPGCEGVYSWPFVGGDSDFYNLAYLHAYGYPDDRWEFDATLKQMNAAGVAGSPCVEMGAGKGAFLRRLLAGGFDAADLWAVEYSQRAREAIAQVNPGIHTLAGPEELETLASEKPGTFGCAFAFQAVEHLGLPLTFLRTLRKLLVPGGRAFISVPNPARIAFNEAHGLLLDMPPNHVSRIGLPAMKALAARTDFDVERFEREPFAAAGAAKEFVNYYYKRRTQLGSSLENWMERTIPGPAAKAIGAALAAPKAVAMLAKRTDGGSVLFTLRKPAL